MSFKAALLALFPFFLVSQVVYGETGYTPQELSLNVQRDGSVIVDYTVRLLDPSTSVLLPGFAADAAPTLKVRDFEGRTVSYNTDGDAVVISAESGDVTSITYKTFTLTVKKGDVWTLSVSSPIQWGVNFPLNTNITSFSATPLAVQKGEPARFAMPSGNQWVTYQLSYEEQPEEQEGSETWLHSNSAYFFIASLTGSSLTGSYFLIYRKFRWSWKIKRLMAKHQQLRDEEKRILLLLSDKKGKALEAEIATIIDLPRTTIWRHIRRLEDDGLVVVEKIGTQNLVRIKG